MNHCETDDQTRKGVQQLSLLLSSASAFSCALLVALKLKALGVSAFTTFPSNVVNLYAVVGLLFSLSIALGATIGFQQTIKASAGHKITQGLHDVCLVQAIACQYFATTLIFGFIVISGVVYKLVVQSKTFERLRRERHWWFMFVFLMPLILTICPLGFNALGIANGLPFCWIVDSKHEK